MKKYEEEKSSDDGHTLRDMVNCLGVFILEGEIGKKRGRRKPRTFAVSRILLISSVERGLQTLHYPTISLDSLTH